jgi:hypothetical protein
MSWVIDGHLRKSGGVSFSVTAIRSALELAGVMFVDENGGRPGREVSPPARRRP